MDRRIIRGLLAIVAFLAVDGARAVYSAFFLFHEMNPFLVILTTACISLIITGMTAYVKSPNTQQKSKDKPCSKAHLTRDYVILNIVYGLNVITAYWSIYYILPAVAMSIAVSIGPIGHTVGHFSTSTPREKVLSALLFILSVFTLSPLALSHTGHARMAIGLSLAVVLGIAMLASTWMCKRLSAAGEPPLRVNTLKSILVVIVAFCLCLKQNLFAISYASLYRLLLFSLFFSFVPQLCLQLAIKHLSMGLLTLCIAAAPIFLAFLQVCFGVAMHFSFGILLCMQSLVLIFLSYIQIKKQA